MVTILHATASDTSEPVETLLWDRKAEGGFPEMKELKNRVRNIIDPGKDMGHIDRRLKKDRETAEGTNGEGLTGTKQVATKTESSIGAKSKPPQGAQKDCEDCK